MKPAGFFPNPVAFDQPCQHSGDDSNGGEIQPLVYVQSGPVRLIFDTANAEQAAVMAFQWTCDKQAEIEAASPLDHVLIAEEQGSQLEDEVVVHEQGFDRWDGQVFETRDIFEAWLRWPLPYRASYRSQYCRARS